MLQISLELASGRKIIEAESVTFTGLVVAAGDDIIAEPALVAGNLCWKDRDGENIGAISVDEIDPEQIDTGEDDPDDD